MTIEEVRGGRGERMEPQENHHLGGVRGSKQVKEAEMKWLLRRGKPGECGAAEVGSSGAGWVSDAVQQPRRPKLEGSG